MGDAVRAPADAGGWPPPHRPDTARLPGRWLGLGGVWPWAAVALPHRSGRLVGMLRAVIEVAVWAVRHPRKQLPLRRTRSLALVRDEHPGHVGQALEALAAALLHRLLRPTTWDENSQHVAILGHGMPCGVPWPLHREADLIHMPLVPRPGTPAPALRGLRWPPLPAPLPDRCIRHEAPTDAQECCHVTRAEAEAFWIRRRL
jgi:hypothetical protein